MSVHSRVFTIAPYEPFLEILAESYLSGAFSEILFPASSLDASQQHRNKNRFYFPTLEAGQEFKRILFHKVQDANSLPEIFYLHALSRAPCQVSEAAPPIQGINCAGENSLTLNASELTLFKQRLLLTQLIYHWGSTLGDKGQNFSPPRLRSSNSAFYTLKEAWQISRGLAETLEEAFLWKEFPNPLEKEKGQESKNPEDIGPLSLEYWDGYSRDVFRFFNIILRSWPDIQSEYGILKEEFQNFQRLKEEISFLEQIRRPKRASTPFDSSSGLAIAAGFVQMDPPTLYFLHQLAHLPAGILVLPGLDQEMDEIAWREIGASVKLHAQMTLKYLLDHLQMPRSAVRPLRLTQKSALVASSSPVYSDPFFHNLSPEERKVPTHLPHSVPNSVSKDRLWLVQEVLRPADSTQKWMETLRKISPQRIEAAFEGVAVAEAPNQQMEARLLATALREVLEIPNQRALLITPDRKLAAHVQEELKRWNIHLDTFPQHPVLHTRIGELCRLILACVASEGSACALTALLHHPCVCATLLQQGKWEEPLTQNLEQYLGRAFEYLIARNHWMPGGLEDLLSILAYNRTATRKLYPFSLLESDIWEALEVILVEFKVLIAPLRSSEARTIQEWAAAHYEVMQLLLPYAAFGAEAEVGLKSLFEILSSVFLTSAEKICCFDVQTYAAFFAEVFSELYADKATLIHPRIKIATPEESRLQSADVILLGGLNAARWLTGKRGEKSFKYRPKDGVGNIFSSILHAPEKWKPVFGEVPADKRNNRSEIQLFSSDGYILSSGLRLNSLQIGPNQQRLAQADHDFLQWLGAPQVLMTYVGKQKGVPLTPVHFVQRLEAFLTPHWTKIRERGEKYLFWARALDKPQHLIRYQPPQPCPPVALRPTTLEVRDIELLRRDPYTFYAKKILRLRPLNRLGHCVGKKETLYKLHHLFAQFARNTSIDPSLNLQEAQGQLINLAQKKLSDRFSEILFPFFPWAGLQKILKSYVEWILLRQPALHKLHLNPASFVTLTLKNGDSVNIFLCPDRIEIDGEGKMNRIDFTIGRPPSRQEIILGFSPKLTLEYALSKRVFLPEARIFADSPAEISVKEQRDLSSFLASSDPSDSQMLDLYRKSSEVKLFYVCASRTAGIEMKEITSSSESIDSLAERHFRGLCELLEDLTQADTPYCARPYPSFSFKTNSYDHLSRFQEWAKGGHGTGLEKMSPGKPNPQSIK